MGSDLNVMLRLNFMSLLNSLCMMLDGLMLRMVTFKEFGVTFALTLLLLGSMLLGFFFVGFLFSCLFVCLSFSFLLGVFYLCSFLFGML